MSTIRCDGCGEYREWNGYTLVKGCSCLGKIGEPTVYDELELLKSDLRKLIKKWPESIPTDELENLLNGGE